MPSGKFRVGVTGDTGIDVYTEYVAGYLSDDERVRSPKGVYDVEVPAGAHFTSLAFKQIFDNDKISVDYILPKDVKQCAGEPPVTLHKHLVRLHRYKDKEIERGQQSSSVLRVKEILPLRDRQERAKSHVFSNMVFKESDLKPSASELDLLVIHDGGGSWREYPDQCMPTATASNAESAIDLVRMALNRPGTGNADMRPRVLIDLNHLPKVVRAEAGNGAASFDPQMTFWKTLLEHRERVIVVCSGNVFRRAGAAISRRLSWEQTIEDLAADLHLFGELQALSQFGHLIIRFGIVGAIHLRRTGGRASDIHANFVFAPTARGGYYRDRVEDGNLRGENAMLTGALVSMIAKSYENGGIFDLDDQKVVAAMKTGLVACMNAYDKGYEVNWDQQPLTREDGTAVVEKLFKHAQPAIEFGYDGLPASRRKLVLGETTIPSDVFLAPNSLSATTRVNWDLLRTAINPHQFASKQSDKDRFQREWFRINIASAIGIFGHRSILNCDWNATPKDPSHKRRQDVIRAVLERPAYVCAPGEKPDYELLSEGELPQLPLEMQPCGVCDETPREMPAIYVPIATFGKLTVVEREEVESLRSIHNLVRNYHEKNKIGGKSTMPISLAVFGPPGSGKSFAVKQIAEEINSSLRDPTHGLEAIEYNVAQFRSIEDLGEAITRASVINNEGKLPLVFFDEFDCRFEDNDLGWLKYFLSPMQDGTFYGAKQTIRIARAIFVFAGGVNPTFERFVEGPSEHLSAESKERRKQAFESQKGPDFISRLRGHINVLPVNPEKSGKRINKPCVRRAIILRGLLEKRDLVKKVRDQDIAQIDEDILFALLTIDNYRHGTRSMEAILQMCTPMDDRIEKTSLPSRIQLDMHVNADEFLIRMYRSRARPPAILPLNKVAAAGGEGKPEKKTVISATPQEPKTESVITAEIVAAGGKTVPPEAKPVGTGQNPSAG